MPFSLATDGREEEDELGRASHATSDHYPSATGTPGIQSPLLSMPLPEPEEVVVEPIKVLEEALPTMEGKLPHGCERKGSKDHSAKQLRWPPFTMPSLSIGQDFFFSFLPELPWSISSCLGTEQKLNIGNP